MINVGELFKPHGKISIRIIPVGPPPLTITYLFAKQVSSVSIVNMVIGDHPHFSFFKDDDVSLEPGLSGFIRADIV